MRRPVAALAAVGVLTALPACRSAEPEADPTPTLPSPAPTVARATTAPRPENRRCFDLSYDEAVAPTTDADDVPCRGEHTALTYFLGRIDAVVDGHLLAVDSDHVQEDIAAACPRRLTRFLGGTEEDQRLSMLRAIWFSPTVEQSDAGEDWFRCDVIALAADEVLAPLTGRLKGVLGRDGWETRYGMCGTDDPARPDFERVVCSADHAWRAIATVDAKGKDYPGVRRLRAHGRTACEDPARAVSPDPLTVTWSYEPPTEGAWDAGQHYGICWVPS